MDTLKLMSESGRPAKNDAVIAEICNPNDTKTFDPAYLYVGTGGTIMAIFEKNPDVSIPIIVQSGSLLPFSIIAVKLTGTTADDILLIR